MIEITVKDYLQGRIDAPVFLEYPAQPPKRFVVLRKGDSGRENLLCYALFVADSFGESLLDAASVNKDVKTAMDSITELDIISAMYPGGDYALTDTKNKRHRYQAVFEITHY